MPVVQMDTVKSGIGEKVLLTLHFVESGFMLAILRNSNTSKSVIDIFTKLYRHLGRETFTKMFPVILTDNGTEFSNPLRLEVDENGEFRTRVFYCDRNRPYQKGSIEVNHEFIRRVIPRGESLERYTQADINLPMSHINSYQYIQKTVTFYWLPAFLMVFLPFQRLFESKKTARLKREWLFFLKFSIKMPEFNRFPSKTYALGLRMFACIAECEW